MLKRTVSKKKINTLHVMSPWQCGIKWVSSYSSVIFLFRGKIQIVDDECLELF